MLLFSFLILNKCESVIWFCNTVKLRGHFIAWIFNESMTFITDTFLQQTYLWIEDRLKSAKDAILQDTVLGARSLNYNHVNNKKKNHTSNMLVSQEIDSFFSKWRFQDLRIFSGGSRWTPFWQMSCQYLTCAWVF